MRIIAAVTLIFLPGTFVATVFSTGLFDWSPESPSPNGGGGGSDGGGSGGMISKYIWVYFMLTGALTALVLVAWVTFSWVQKRRMVRQFGFDLEDEEGGGARLDWGGKGERRDTEMTLVEQSAFQRWKMELSRMSVMKGAWRKGNMKGTVTEEELKSA